RGVQTRVLFNLLLVCLFVSAATSFVGPSFLKEPPSRVDFANETGARIDCSAGGSPPPNISWLSGDGKPVGSIPETRELLANGSLLFPPFRPSGYRHDVHAATYRCVAENTVGRIHSRDVRVRAGEYNSHTNILLVFNSVYLQK
ncbi:hypothetical protein C0J52_10805, partial [Blattella germanica]